MNLCARFDMKTECSVPWTKRCGSGALEGWPREVDPQTKEESP